MVTPPVPSRRQVVNPVRPGREQRQQRTRAPGCGWWVASTRGEVSERPKEHAWKVCMGESPSRVRIPSALRQSDTRPGTGCLCFENTGEIASRKANLDEHTRRLGWPQAAAQRGIVPPFPFAGRSTNVGPQVARESDKRDLPAHTAKPAGGWPR